MTQKPRGKQSQIKASIAEWIEWNGGYAVVTNISGIPIKGDFSRMRKNPEMAGLGDVISCWYGEFHQFEVKPTDKAQLDPDQLDHQHRTERGGGFYHQVVSVDDVIRILEARKAKITLQNPISKG